MSHDYWALMSRVSALQQENTLQWEVHAPQQRVAPSHYNQRKSHQSNKDPAQSKGKYYPPIEKKKKKVREEKQSSGYNKYKI